MVLWEPAPRPQVQELQAELEAARRALELSKRKAARLPLVEERVQTLQAEVRAARPTKQDVAHLETTSSTRHLPGDGLIQ